VSFYNQSILNGKEVPVFPTPTIGMIGVIEDVRNIMSLNFKSSGDHIFLIGKVVEDIASSEYLVKYHKVEASPAPYFDLDEEFILHQCVSNVISKKLINAAHDCADGGLFVSLVEMAMASNFGFEIVTGKTIRQDAFLFGESQGRVVVTVKNDQLESFKNEIDSSGIPYVSIGRITTVANIVIDNISFGSVDSLKEISENVIKL
jgi:phosphoribosylformylglycinamidine synthase